MLQPELPEIEQRREHQAHEEANEIGALLLSVQFLFGQLLLEAFLQAPHTDNPDQATNRKNQCQGHCRNPQAIDDKRCHWYSVDDISLFRDILYEMYINKGGLPLPCFFD